MLCVVFDIDETLIHNMGPNIIEDYWEKLTEDQKASFDYIVEETKNGKLMQLIRPNIKQLFKYFVDNYPEIRVGLYTYSEQEYAIDIGNKLTKYLGLPKNFFLFTYGEEQIVDYGEDYPKNLRLIYENFPQFNESNTILVDDLPSNIYHIHNIEQSILIQPFNPFGTFVFGTKNKAHTSKRQLMNEYTYEMAKNDIVFIELKKIIQAVLQDIRGCEGEDYLCKEPIFSPKRVKRMGLDNFYKPYVKKWEYMMTIGTPVQSDVLNDKPFRKVLEFEIPPSTLARSATAIMGGSRSKKRKQKRLTKTRVNKNRKNIRKKMRDRIFN